MNLVIPQNQTGSLSDSGLFVFVPRNLAWEWFLGSAHDSDIIRFPVPSNWQYHAPGYLFIASVKSRGGLKNLVDWTRYYRRNLQGFIFRTQSPEVQRIAARWGYTARIRDGETFRYISHCQRLLEL